MIGEVKGQIMTSIRKAEERGLTRLPWLESRHTFSFGGYQDPKHMGFQMLRVINEDKIQGGTGFAPHSHQNMEIISYVVEGSLVHKDSMGNKTVILPNEVQRMSAGTGVTHSEYNNESDKVTHFYQIWIYPNKIGLPASYEQKSFEPDLKKSSQVLVVSPDGRDGSLSINQDAYVYLWRMPSGKMLPFECKPNRCHWIQVIKGKLRANSYDLRPGDGLAITEVLTLSLTATDACEFMLFDLMESSPIRKD
jgi:quercetin 2,3-dioxygenase